MIKAVLLDLDDTLISTQTTSFVPEYLEELGAYFADLAAPDAFIRDILASYALTMRESDGRSPLFGRFITRFGQAINVSPSVLNLRFNEFYTTKYDKLRHFISAQSEAPGILDFLYANAYQIVVATNPAIPDSAIRLRMDWGGIPSPDSRIELVTSLETMHFGKPDPAYYEEVMARLDRLPGEAIMVGNDWDNDIVPANLAGLATYWVTEDGHSPPLIETVSGHGTFEQFVSLTKSGWLNGLVPPNQHPRSLVHRLRAFPAAIDALLISYESSLLESSPGPREWSVRDIICHLGDHERSEDRPRLEAVVANENPFISANYFPWANADSYQVIPVRDAFDKFVEERRRTVEWLDGLSDDVWSRSGRHAMVGPTTFRELLRFTTEHDYAHLRQMRRVLAPIIRPSG
jgi:FMN phosphatase YigB (HAD superfamily)